MLKSDGDDVRFRHEIQAEPAFVRAKSANLALILQKNAHNITCIPYDQFKLQKEHVLTTLWKEFCSNLSS